MLFRKDIEPMCAYCHYSNKLSNVELSCKYRGVTRASDSCRHFKYEPLKRVPPKPARLVTRGLSDEDFKLDENL
ncbi:MAG: hypothetical protein ACOX1Q_07755 [Eubacteriales bacterium]